MFERLLSDFQSYFYDFDNSAKFIINVGAELEFYYDSDFILNKNHRKIKEIEDILLTNELIDNLEEEDGENQFEIHFSIEQDANVLVEKINKVKKILEENNCILSAKPKINNPGSSIHFNISLYLDDINLFQKNPQTGEYMVFLYQAIGGMLDFLEESIYIFAPTEECYRRFRILNENERYIHQPMNCSWGFNNRTVAIRVPTTFSAKYPNSRIEHRVCSALADPRKSLFAILYSIFYGITNFVKPIEPVFGNAFSNEFDDILKPFPRNLIQAKKKFEKSRIKKILEI